MHNDYSCGVRTKKKFSYFYYLGGCLDEQVPY